MEKGFSRGVGSRQRHRTHGDAVVSARPAAAFRLEPGCVSPPPQNRAAQTDRTASSGTEERPRRPPRVPEFSAGPRRRPKPGSFSAELHPPSQVSLVDAKPRRRTERFPINPFFRLRTPSLPMGLWPRFRVSRLCVWGCGYPGGGKTAGGGRDLGWGGDGHGVRLTPERL